MTTPADPSARPADSVNASAPGTVPGSWDRLADEALVELADVARDMEEHLSGKGLDARPVRLAYRDLADTADRLRLLREGADRRRERRQAAETAGRGYVVRRNHPDRGLVYAVRVRTPAGWVWTKTRANATQQQLTAATACAENWPGAEVLAWADAPPQLPWRRRPSTTRSDR